MYVYPGCGDRHHLTGRLLGQALWQIVLTKALSNTAAESMPEACSTFLVILRILYHFSSEPPCIDTEYPLKKQSDIVCSLSDRNLS